MEEKGINTTAGSEMEPMCQATGYFLEVRNQEVIIPMGKRDGVWSQIVSIK